MIDIKKGKLIITIKTKTPEKYVTQLSQSLLGSVQRMTRGEDVFNDPDTLTDMEVFLELQKELSLTMQQLERTFHKDTRGTEIDKE